MTVIEVKENGAIRTKMLSCDSPIRHAVFTRLHCPLVVNKSSA